MNNTVCRKAPSVVLGAGEKGPLPATDAGKAGSFTTQDLNAAYAWTESLAPGVERAELFARQSRSGWATWGNESAKFDAAEIAA
jgi:hypothetical protein